MSAEVERLNERMHRATSRMGRTVVHAGELLRHSVYTRVVHWAVAIFFILALLSGFAIFTPWLYAWLAPLFGSGPRTRLLHPWFGLIFCAAFLLMLFNWLQPMNWNESDRRWLRRMREYATNEEKMEPEDVGKFNAGQKLWFRAIVVAAIVFLITGFIMWWPEIFGRVLMWISYFLHDVAALVMLGGFIIHIYEGTAQQPGTFRAMTRGTVTDRWAWTHHPAWYREVTGRDPRADYERAAQRQEERQRMLAAWEREQDARERQTESRPPGPA
ncbi:MAG TPA: formate dehydrogenase subunit gamma [Blastocatellia bacterium]|nr:formate dehydrogenase subunit gamma [Blastocatellia bacterium]